MILKVGKHSHLKNKGFTLIEIVLVSIIIVILVGVSSPVFRNSFSGIQAKDACQNLVYLMRYLQAKSIAERVFSRVNFDFKEGLFWASLEKKDQPGEFERLKGKWGKAYKIPQGISLSLEAEDEPVIEFYPDGSSSSVKIKISDNKAAAFSINTQRTIRYEQVNP